MMERMLRKDSVIILVLVLLSCFRKLVSASTLEDDVTALGTIASLLTNANDLGWTGNDPCGSKWKGITCDNDTRTNVVELDLFGVGLRGSLSPAIKDLRSLTSLDLSFNPNLTGPIPSEIGELTNLVSLNLQACSFNGQIPGEIGNLQALKFLALNKNRLTGTIPATLGNLSSLTWFDISENFLQGALPTSTQNTVGLDNLTAAEHFHFNNNSLSGVIPKEICSLPKLLHLLLDSNNFNGSIPEEIGNLIKLQILRLDNNQFSGAIPNNISNLRNLTEMHAKNNSLIGSLPDFTALTKLTLLSLGENGFDAQEIPQSIASLSSLITLDVDNDNLIGPFPPAILQLSTLETISAIRNHLNGSLRFDQSSATRLRIARFDYNNITDVAFGAGTLSVTLIGNPVCSSSHYQLGAEVCSGSSTNSTYSSNTSCIVTDCSARTQNPVTCQCQYPYVIEILLTSPPFTELSNERMKNLTNVLQKQLGLETGQVWVHDGRVTSNSRIIATVYLFATANKDSLTNDEFDRVAYKIRHHEISLGIFGPYLLQAIIKTPPASGSEHSKGIHGAALIGVIVGVVAAVVIILSISIYACKEKRRADKATSHSKQFASWGLRSTKSGSGPQLKGAQYFSSAELKKATDNYSGSKVLGQGAYGKVYKGTLITGEVVAVKKAEGGTMKSVPGFKTEIELLSRVHHRNLVNLIGFCYEENEQMLVYEYMSKGTLRDRLNGSQSLSWKKRLEIAANSAKGIAYLHEMANPPIIHRDIKSTNILLDDKLVAKVSDFGLSKLASEEGHVSTQVKGTMGYLDPEYYMTQQLSEKSDVYSFGVVLLEIISAKPPIDKGKYIVREVRTALETAGINKVVELLDPRLRNYTLGDLEKYVRLALDCVNDLADPRPTMGEVVKELEILLANVSSYDEGVEVASTGPPTPAIKSADASFDYSGGFQIPIVVEPK